MMKNDFDYLLKLPGAPAEQAWLRERLETLSVREGYILAAAFASFILPLFVLCAYFLQAFFLFCVLAVLCSHFNFFQETLFN